MWAMIPSLRPFVDCLAPAFTQPSFASHCRLLLGWLLCLGRHTLCRVACSDRPEVLPDRSQRHGFDADYNFFARAAWTPSGLAYRVGVLILSRLTFLGRIT